MKIINWFRENPALTAILLLATFLRVFRADYQSIALDEVLSMNNSNPKLSITELYDSVMFWEYLPHLYFFLLRIVFEIFGFSSLVGRLFSAFIGVVGVYAIYLLGKELLNKKTGLIAALFLSVNYFHIFYSQEIRLYGMLFLFSILSFYRLVIFIKNSTVRNAVYYGIFTGLIIHAHFFGFITIFAQALILLYFTYGIHSSQRKGFFTNSAIAGAVALLVILPCYPTIVRMLGINSFWLAPPTADIYGNLIKEFFGNSEMVLFGISILLVYYFMTLFNHGPSENTADSDIRKDGMVLSGVILFAWTVISLLLPLLKSHLDISMIISRYFISIVAAVLIAIAIGISHIRSHTIKMLVVAYVTVFSIVDLFAVKKYYSTVNKTQFRELTDAIKEKNTQHSKIVTVWSWILPHFFADQPQVRIENGTIDGYVSGMKNGTIKPEAFWFSNTGANTFELPEDLKAYLEEHFILKEKLEFNDAWANYYVPKNAAVALSGNDFNLSLFVPEANLEQGVTLSEDSHLKTGFVKIEKGAYDLTINASSTPADKTAQFKIKINGDQIAEYNLEGNSEKAIPFRYDKDEAARFQLIYKRSPAQNNAKVLIRSISLKKAK